MSNNIKEKKDVVTYYFEGNDKKEIVVSVPILTDCVPWNITNRGGGITFNIYHCVGENSFNLINDNIPTFIPTDETTKIYVVKVLPTKGVENSIYLVQSGVLSDFDDVSGIIFQQLTSFNEAYLYVEFKTQNISYTMVNKYGNTNVLDNMIKIPFDNPLSAINNNDIGKIVNLSIQKDKEGKLFYASFIKENRFSTKNNDKVNFYIPKRYAYKLYNLNHENINIKSENGDNYVLYSGSHKYFDYFTSDNFYDEIISNPEKKKVDSGWKLEDGLLSLDDLYPNAPSIKKFPNSPIFEQTIDGKHYIFFYENIIEENIETGKLYPFWLIEINGYKLIEIDGVKTYIEIDPKNPNKKFITTNSYYGIVPKSIKLNNKIIEIEDDNGFIYPNDNTKHYCYQDEFGRWYVSIPSMKFVLSGTQKEITIQNEIIKEGNDLSYTYNNVQYFPSLKAQINSGFTFNLLQSVDGEEKKEENKSEKDYFILLNNNKHSLSAENNKIQITPFINCLVSENNASCVLQDNYYFDLFNNPNRKYVVINFEKNYLIDNRLIYEGNEYNITKNDDDEYIIIGNNGYSVYNEPNEYYCIINNEKYSYSTDTNSIKIKEFTDVLDISYETEELINESFRFNLNMDELLSSDIITATYGGNNVTNGYVTVNEKKYDVKKNIFLIENDDNSYSIDSEEYVELDLSNQTLTNTVSWKINDDTFLISEDEYFNGFFETNKEFYRELTEDITVTINDYTSIAFSSLCVVKFNGDYKIKVKSRFSSKYNDYQVYKNEIFIIQSGHEVIFTDVTSITFIYSSSNKIKIPVFENVVNIGDKPYHSKVINGQNAIEYDKNIYYIYNNHVKINGNEHKVYDRCIYLKNVFLGMLQTINFTEINDIILEVGNSDEKVYGCVSGNTVEKIQDLTTYDEFKWTIYLPYFNVEKNKLMLSYHTLYDFEVYKSGETKYNSCKFSGYTNVNVFEEQGPIRIENGKFEINIDFDGKNH